MRRLFRAAAVWAALAAARAAADSAPAGFRLVDGTAASVNGEVIFLSDVARDECLYRCAAAPAEEIPGILFPSVRDRLVADLLVLQEQRKLGLGEVDNAALAAATEAAERAVAACAAPCAASLPAAEVRAFVSRRLLVRDFLARRVSLFVEVTDQEVEAEAARRRAAASGGEALTAPETVRAELVASRTAAEIRNWFARAASKARIVVPLPERP